MAVQKTPGESGIPLQPNELIGSWTRHNTEQRALGETVVTYETFIQQIQGEEQ